MTNTVPAIRSWCQRRHPGNTCIATEFKNDDIRTKELGLTEDELAFYDLLSANEKIINQTGPIQDLVHRVVALVKKNLPLDWTKKEDARSAIRLAVKKEKAAGIAYTIHFDV